MKTIAYYRIEPVYQEDIDADFIRQAAIGVDAITGEAVDGMCSGGDNYLSIATMDAIRARKVSIA